MAKIDALTPRKSEEVYDDSKRMKVESIPELVEKELAKEKQLSPKSSWTRRIKRSC